MARTRERLPFTTRWTEDETRLLYNRWSAMKNRAKAKDQPFPWMKFGEFFAFVEAVSPQDYTPSLYRIEWGDSGYDYRPEAIKFARKSIQNSCAMAVELALLLVSVPGTLNDLLAEAARRANYD